MEEKLETQMEEKNTYQKPDFENDEKFSALTAVSEKSYLRIDILADVAKLCESEGVSEDFGKMLIDYYKFAIDKRQACPDRPIRAKNELSNVQLVLTVMRRAQAKIPALQKSGLSNEMIVKFISNSPDFKEHNILKTPHPERTIASVLSQLAKKDFLQESDSVLKLGRGLFVAQTEDKSMKPPQTAYIDYTL